MANTQLNAFQKAQALFSQLKQGAGNTVNDVASNIGRGAQVVGQAVGNAANQANYNAWHSPVGIAAINLQKGAANVQNFLESPKSINPIPTVQPFSNKNIFGQVNNFVANVPGMLGNSITSPILNLGSDLATNVGRTLRGDTATPYQNLKSPISRLEYNIAGVNRTPQQVIGNVAGTGVDVSNYLVPKAAEGIVKEGITQVGKAGLGQVIKEGAITGAKQLAMYNFLQGLSDARNQSLPNQAIGGAKQAAVGAGIGLVTGGALSGGGHIGGSVVNSIMDAVKSIHPRASADQINQLTKNYIRDRAGKFAKGQAQPQVAGLDNKMLDRSAPFKVNDWMSKVDQKLGVPSNPQAGFIRFGAKVGDKADLSSEAVVGNAGIKANSIPTQTEIKNRAEVAAGNPDLYTQRKGVWDNMEKDPAWLTRPENSDVLNRLSPQKLEKVPQGVEKTAQAASINQETKNKVTLPINGKNESERVQSAIVNSERIKNEINIRGKEAYTAGTKLSSQDLKLAEKYQEGIPVATLAKDAQNPQAFTKAMNKISDYYDFRLAADRAAGGDTPLRANYLRQRWDLSNPEDMTRFNQLAEQRGLKPYNGYSSQPRVFNNYAEGEALGFKRQNPSILHDLKDDFGASSSVISKQTLKQGLTKAAPEKVSTQGVGMTPEGQPFVNTNIPGLEGMSFHPDVNKQLKGFQPVNGNDLFEQVRTKGLVQGIKDTGVGDTVASLYDHASQPMKHFLLNFSGFHSLNVSGNYAGAEILNPAKSAKGLAESVPAFFSEGATSKIIDGFKNKTVAGKDYSVFDAGLRSGVNMDRGLPGEGMGKLNPFSVMSRAIFDRELHTLKLNLVDQVFSSGKIDPESPAGHAAAKEINMIMGEMNNRTMNINPNTQKWFSRLFLAPGFTESKYKLLADSATKGGPQGSLARKAVIGKSIVMGSLATFGTLLATGEFPTLQQTLTNYTLNPSIQTNLTNPKGQKQDVVLPTTYLSEPAKPLGGLLQGSTDELTHYGQARLNPLLSTGISAYTNKDYYGKPIVDPNSDTPAAVQVAQNLGVGRLPIGAQNVISAAQGKTTPTQAAIQIAGLRTKTSPNDPQQQTFNDLPKYQQAEAKTSARQKAAVKKVADILMDKNVDVQRKTAIVQALKKDPAIFNRVKAEIKGKAAGVTPADRAIMSLSDKQQAAYVYDHIKAKQSTEEKRQLVLEYVKKGILTKNVIKEMKLKIQQQAL